MRNNNYSYSNGTSGYLSVHNLMGVSELLIKIEKKLNKLKGNNALFFTKTPEEIAIAKHQLNYLKKLFPAKDNIVLFEQFCFEENLSYFKSLRKRFTTLEKVVEESGEYLKSIEDFLEREATRIQATTPTMLELQEFRNPRI